MLSTLFGLNLAVHGPLLAQVNTGILPIIEGYEPVNLIKEAIAWSIILAAVLCIVFIFIGGLSFILSGGQDEKITQAVATIRYAIIGLVIVILSVTLVNVITFIFKVPFDVVNYREILDKVQSLSQLFQQDSFYDNGGGSYDGGL